MRKDTEILLVNSYAPRQRVISDTALENSLAIIRTSLKTRGVNAEVVDDQRLGDLGAGVPQWCQRLLKFFTVLQLKYIKFKAIAALLLLATWPLHAFALQRRRDYMRQRINQVVSQIQEQRIPFVGVKLWYGDAYKWSRELAAAVRRHCPGTIIIVGGPQVKVYGEMVLADPNFDIAIAGPGEEMMAELVLLYRRALSRESFLEQVRTVYGGQFITTGGYAGDRDKLVQQLARQTIPVYRDEDLRDKILFHTIVDGVGCSWNNCNFCSHTRCRVNYAPRPVEDIIAEMETMLRRGIAFFRFSSSETTPAHGRKIAEAILARGLDIRFSMFIRAARPNAEVMEAYRIMIRAGLRAVFMGGETGHDGVNREIMNKGVERRDIIETIATIRLAADAAAAPCRVGLSLIYPCPLPAGVTLEEVYQANLELIDATLPDTVIVNPPGPFPATRWFDDADKFGFSFAQGSEAFARKFMQYEYSIYKPAELWEDMGFSLHDMKATALIKETGRLRAYAASLGIPTDISDEYLMMTEAIGIRSKLDLMVFKQQSLLDIICGGSDYTRRISAAINAASRQLAASNAVTVSRRRGRNKINVARRVIGHSLDRLTATSGK